MVVTLIPQVVSCVGKFSFAIRTLRRGTLGRELGPEWEKTVFQRVIDFGVFENVPTALAGESPAFHSWTLLDKNTEGSAVLSVQL